MQDKEIKEETNTEEKTNNKINTKNNKKKYTNYKIFVILIDALLVLMASYLSIAVRFEFKYIPIDYIDVFIKTIFFNFIIYFSIFWMFKIYNTIWAYFSVEESVRVAVAVVVAVIIEFILFIFTPLAMPVSYYLIKTFTLTLLMFMFRALIRIVKERTKQKEECEDPTVGTNVMIIGAGSAGSLVIRELRNYKKVKYNIRCILDDNYLKKKNRLRGIQIVGDTTQIAKAVKKYDIDEIIIAIPSASKDRIGEIARLANEADTKLMIFEGLYDKLKKNFMASVREASYEDLLERDPIKVDDKEIKKSIKDQVVLVTGAGGSIGSELSRQIMANKPKKLIVLDIYENNAYDIQMELENEYGHKNLDVVIASVRDYGRLEEIYKKYKPDTVFHAAAHKHVPLMESSPNEAIKNNCLGTLNAAELADKYKVKNFVLISTDKAVRPTSIMGATKRICEMIIQAYSRKSKTRFVAVRFGNVLGSNGSVIPLFMKQIEQGGPVTVTHKEMRRFFMTIPEAVQLILQASTYAKGGEIFALDMGKPVKIYDLAEHLIRLSGFEPNVEIPIEITGLRPGEKLYEEILMDEEGLKQTENKLIYIGRPIEMNDKKFFKELDELIKRAHENKDGIKELTKAICPTYCEEQNGINELESNKEEDKDKTKNKEEKETKEDKTKKKDKAKAKK